MRPQNEIRGIARTVIESASPALQPVEALRRFVIKSRVDVVMAPLAEAREKAPSVVRSVREEATARRRSRSNGGSQRKAAS